MGWFFDFSNILNAKDNNVGNSRLEVECHTIIYIQEELHLDGTWHV